MHQDIAAQILAEIKALREGNEVRFNGIDARFDAVDAEISLLKGMHGQLHEYVDFGFKTVFARLDAMDTRMEREFTQIRGAFETVNGRLDALEKRRHRRH